MAGVVLKRECAKVDGFLRRLLRLTNETREQGYLGTKAVFRIAYIVFEDCCDLSLVTKSSFFATPDS